MNIEKEKSPEHIVFWGFWLRRKSQLVCCHLSGATSVIVFPEGFEVVFFAFGSVFEFEVKVIPEFPLLRQGILVAQVVRVNFDLFTARHRYCKTSFLFTRSAKRKPKIFLDKPSISQCPHVMFYHEEHVYATITIKCNHVAVAITELTEIGFSRF